MLSCHADACLTNCLANWLELAKTVPFIPASKAHVSMVHVTITSNVADRLCQAISSPALEKGIMSTNGWNDWFFNSVDWDSQAKALGTLESHEELFVIKWVHNLLPARHHMKRLGQVKSNLRPSCLETAPHIFTCERRVQWQAGFFYSLRKLLAKICTQPDLQTILVTGIQGALQDDPLFDMPTLSSQHLPRTTFDDPTCFEAASVTIGSSRSDATTSITRMKMALCICRSTLAPKCSQPSLDTSAPNGLETPEGRPSQHRHSR
jgi:hypothetical protein